MHLYYARFLCHFCKDQGLVAHRYSTQCCTSSFAVHLHVCMLSHPLSVFQGAFLETAGPGSDQGPDFQTGRQRPVPKERRNRLLRYTLPEFEGCLSVWHISNRWKRKIILPEKKQRVLQFRKKVESQEILWRDVIGLLQLASRPRIFSLSLLLGNGINRRSCCYILRLSRPYIFFFLLSFTTCDRAGASRKQ